MRRGNIVVEVNIDDYRKGVKELMFSIVGRLSLQRGDTVIANMILKQNPQSVWGTSNIKFVLMKVGIYHILLSSFEDQGLVMAIGPVNLKLGIFSSITLVLGF